MATGDYCTLEELKRRLWPSGETPDDIDDVDLQNRLTAVSREIDHYTGRRFYTTSSDETRYYTADDTHVLWTDDIQSVTTLKTDDEADRTYSTTWTTDDYDLLPFNAALDDVPYTHIERAPLGDYSFPTTRKGVQIVGKFGYSSSTDPEDTPATVKDALIFQVQLDLGPGGGPEGYRAAFGGAGATVILHPDVMRRLNPLRRNYT